MQKQTKYNNSTLKCCVVLTTKIKITKGSTAITIHVALLWISDLHGALIPHSSE